MVLLSIVLSQSSVQTYIANRVTTSINKKYGTEINIEKVTKINGMDVTFVTSAKTDEEGYALLKEFGVPFKNIKNN